MRGFLQPAHRGAADREHTARSERETARLLTRLRLGAFSLQATTNANGDPSVTFQVAPAVAAEDPLLVTEVLDAVEAELEERKLTLGLGLDEFQRLGRWYGDDIAWQLKELLEQGALHQRQWDRLTDVARGVVIALVAAPEAQLLAAKTLTDFSLGPKSTVSSTLDDLIE